MFRILFTLLAFALSLSTYAVGYVFQFGRGISAVWNTTDMIGIFAEGSTQSKFAVNSVNYSNNHQASFNGYGIRLNNNRKYFGISPYNTEYYQNDDISTALPLSFPTLTQTANDDISHIAPSDLMTASVTTTSENTATFNFSHLCNIVRLSVLVPEDVTFTGVTMFSTRGTFIQNATLNLEMPSIVPSSTSSTLSMALDNICVTRGSKLTVYLIFLPTNMTGGNITATFSTTSGKTYACNFEGRNFTAGNVYNIGRTLQASSATARERIAIPPLSEESESHEARQRVVGVVTYPDAVTTDFALALNDETYDALPLLKGDADNNDKVNNNDITATARHIMGNTPVNFNATAADANSDGKINVGDLTRMSNIINKK